MKMGWKSGQPGVLSSNHPRGSTSGNIARSRPIRHIVNTCIPLILGCCVLLWYTSSLSRRTVRIELAQLPNNQLEDSSTKREQLHLPLQLDPLFWIQYAEDDAMQHKTLISQDCNARLGRAFLQKFTDASGTICGGEDGAVSRVDCFAYPVEQKGLACIASNLLLDGNGFMGKGPAIGAGEHSAYLPEGGSGTVNLGCRIKDPLNKHGAVTQQLHTEQQPWLQKAYRQVDAESIQNQCQEPGVSHAHPVLFISRLDPTNPYHHTQSVVQAFLTLAALSNANQTAVLQDLQVILADHFAEGPFIEIWKRLSHPRAVTTLSKLASQQPVACFERAILAHYASPSSAFLGYEGVGQEHTCPSILLMAVSHWLRFMFLDSLSSLVLEPKNSATAIKRAQHILAVPAGQQQLSVVYVSRSWFERGMLAGGGLTSWQQQRLMSPEAESAIVTALQHEVHQWNLRACVPPMFGWWQTPVVKALPQGCKKTNVTFQFQVAELSTMDLYPDQALMWSKTGVLIASHGAALTNQIFMRPNRGAIVEAWYNNFHYLNQAHMLGHLHIKTTNNANDMASAVRQAMDHVAARY